MIQYDVYKTPSKVEGKSDLYHARVAKCEGMSFKELKRLVDEHSTASAPDVTLVVEALIKELKTNLLDGRSVEIGGLGTFSLSVTSPICENKRLVNAARIKVNGINFKPRKELLDEIQQYAHFEKTKNSFHSNDYSDVEILGLLRGHFLNNKYITRREFQHLCGFTRSTAIRRINVLCNGDHPHLKREGPKGGAIYVPVNALFGSKI
ncbi:MAG: HU family DNA-binding protein [Parabacteroides sp.]